jgi:hypothetical protein
MVEDFMCDVVPEAKHSCFQLQRGQIHLPKVNPSVNLDYDILAVYAYEQGYVKQGMSRKDTAFAIGEYITRTRKEIPRKCNQDVATKLYEWLVDSEKAMFSDSWTATRMNDLNDSFADFVTKGKICDVDVEEALKDQDWCEFFGGL